MRGAAGGVMMTGPLLALLLSVAAAASSSSPSSGCWRPAPATLECRGADLGALLASLGSPAQQPASVLAIARSNISYLPDNTFSPSSGAALTELGLTSSGLLSLSPASLAPLTSLAHLDLSSNQLGRVPRALASLAQLRTLDLAGNSIAHIDPGIFSNMTRLTSLRLDSNLLELGEELSLAPLHASLVTLSLADNGLARLPDLFGQTFTRLSHLDLSHNRLAVLPTTLLRQTPALETLVLDNNLIETIVLEPLPASLRSLSMLGNKLRCDCKSLWLRRLLDRAEVAVALSPCWSPFSRHTQHLEAFEGTSLCSLSENDRIPKFFRVTDRDLVHFPSNSFSSLQLESVRATGKSRHQVNVSISIQLEFYYNEYDWGVIYREIGGQNNKFYKTQYNLRDYAADHADWSPRSEAVTFPVQLRHGDRGGYHELCLAVIETSTVYYLHQDLCREVGGPRPGLGNSSLSSGGHNLTLAPGRDRLTLAWSPPRLSRTVRLTVRQFSAPAPMVSQLVTHPVHNDTRDEVAYYTVTNLAPDTGYTVCLEPVAGDGEAGDEEPECMEAATLPSSPSTVTQVAAATAVSSSGTALIVAAVCCCCWRRRRRDGDRELEGKEARDVNDNSVQQPAAHQHQLQHHGGSTRRHLHQQCAGPAHSRASTSYSRGCAGPHLWLGCGGAQTSDQSQDYNTATLTCSNNTTATASSDTEADTCSEQDPAHVLYDCIKSDLQTSASTQTGGGGQRDHPSVRSAQSLSSKYTAGPATSTEAKCGVRKNASMCVRSEQSHHHHEPSQQVVARAGPPSRHAADKLASAEFVESDLKINTSSGRVVLRKQYSAQPSQFHSFRAPPPYYRPAISHHVYGPAPAPAPDYVSPWVGGAELRRTASHAHPGRSKYYPATFSHAPVELRPVKLKKSFKRVGKTDSVKMYTWSPYTSSLFYTDPKLHPAHLPAPGHDLGLQF